MKYIVAGDREWADAFHWSETDVPIPNPTRKPPTYDELNVKPRRRTRWPAPLVGVAPMPETIQELSSAPESVRSAATASSADAASEVMTSPPTNAAAGRDTAGQGSQRSFTGPAAKPTEAD